MIRPVLAILPAVATGCAAMLPAPNPMHFIRADARSAADPARCLLVLLPGAGDHDTAFFEQGFVDAVKAHPLDVDVVAADASLGYYGRGIVWDRLAADVIKPAQAGHPHTWLAGISMGGLGVLVYPREQPGSVDGVFAMAPFLGDQKLIDEIEAAGGLKKWSAPPRVERIDSGNYQRELWRWLQAVTEGKEKGPEIYLGFGSSDRLARADGVLAAELPPDHVYQTEGAHEWAPWRKQWATFLEQSDFARQCARSPASSAESRP